MPYDTPHARRAFAAGLISEADAWTALKNIVPSVARTYASWQEYGEHYLLGRGLGRSGLPDLAFPGEDEVRALLDPENRASPWNVVPWDTIYDPDRPR
ncbi:DUF1266 domain-containing protein [Streptomyces sp. NPDC058739]|uniref:DUF1266 domain-containing protein n=1 Tax=Streptomyces sp. NPDC058739 TaxID=3346618 RepID=UPI0036AFFC15